MKLPLLSGKVDSFVFVGLSSEASHMRQDASKIPLITEQVFKWPSQIEILPKKMVYFNEYMPIHLRKRAFFFVCVKFSVRGWRVRTSSCSICAPQRGMSLYFFNFFLGVFASLFID